MEHTKKNRKKAGMLLLMMVLWTLTVCTAFAAKKPSKPGQVKNVKVTASGTSAHKITWKKVSGATGYQIYCRDYSSGSKKYKKVKTVKGASNVSCTIKSRKQGKAYAYVVRAYKKNSAGVSYGKFSSIAYGYIKKSTTSSSTSKTSSSTSSTAKTSTTSSSSTSSDILTNPTSAQKYKKVFGSGASKASALRYPGAYYSSSSEASKNMKSITVKTWDFKSGRSGTKYTRTFTIKVHKNLATTVQKIFNEIYNNSEKFPIHELGGYEWRGGHSEHNTGTAIDINWTENYMIKNGTIVAGSYWRPGSDPYSIPTDGVVATIFKKYGFSQGDWGSSKDYMHFSYFGT